MKTEQFELILENDEKVNCSKGGQGNRMAYICGPGTFYLNSLDVLENEYTFFTCDSVWTYRKSKDLEVKTINTVTKDSLKQRDHMVVNALKRRFNVEKMDGFGFSAPGALLFEEALDH